MPESHTVTLSVTDPTKVKAYAAFMDHVPVSQIAINLGLPKDQIVAWVESDGWRKRRQELVRARNEDIEVERAEYVAYTRLTKVREMVKAADRAIAVLEIALKHLEDNPDLARNFNSGRGITPISSQINSLVSALKAATDIQARALNITGSSDDDRGAGTTKGKVPLVAVGLQLKLSKDGDVTNVNAQAREAEFSEASASQEPA